MRSQGIQDYRWKNRILLLVDGSLKTKDLNAQLTTLLREKEALEERDLLIFLVTEHEVATAAGKDVKMNAKELRKNLGIPVGFKGTLLIGKDGGLKMKKGFLVSPKTIFELIDSMPMRRTEIRNSEKS